MTLRKLSAPGINPGGVDKLYGEDWNRLIDALTGAAAESITLRGNLVRSGANPLVEILGDDANSYAGVRLQGRDAWDILAMAAAGAPTGGLKFRDTATGATISFDRDGNVGIPATKRLYLDRDSNGVGSDTWIEENSANNIRFRSGSTSSSLEDRFSFQKANSQLTTLQVLLGDGASGLQSTLGNGTAAQSFVIRAWDGSAHVERIRLDASGQVVIPATKRLYLDGSGGAGGDTYISEASADLVQVVAGGSVSAKFESSIFKGLLKSHTADPTTANIEDGFFAVKNTTTGEVRMWVNDGGTMKKSAAFT